MDSPPLPRLLLRLRSIRLTRFVLPMSSVLATSASLRGIKLRAACRALYILHFRCLFHKFYLDVACVLSRCCKSRSGVAYVAIAINLRYKCMFQMFTYVASVLSGYCICCSGYIHILQAYVPNVLPILDMCCMCFTSMLHMLQ
jgi:hypothetical protein